MSITRLLETPDEASRLLSAGGVVAIATETVYGLAARFDSPEAVAKIFLAKGRPTDNPLIVHIADASWLPRLTTTVPVLAHRLLEQFAPGPITVTMPRGAQVSDAVTAGLPTVAVRIPAHPSMQSVLQRLNVPLVAPSANRSGRPSPTNWQAVLEDLNGRIDGILKGPQTEIGIESTVVDCCSTPPVLLRPGGIPYESLLELAPDLVLYDPAHQDIHQAPSPGLRHRHYSPQCVVTLIDAIQDAIPDTQAAVIGLERHPMSAQFAWTQQFDSVQQYANRLFQCFRQADQDQLKIVYCQRVALDGIGRGLMDRIQRATE